MRDEITDGHGNEIYLTDERWEHIVERHPELDGHRAEILNAVRTGKRRRDPLLLDTFYYNKTLKHLPGMLQEIEVVVVFDSHSGNSNNFIVTAYPV